MHIYNFYEFYIHLQFVFERIEKIPFDFWYNIQNCARGRMARRWPPWWTDKEVTNHIILQYGDGERGLPVDLFYSVQRGIQL